MQRYQLNYSCTHVNISPVPLTDIRLRSLLKSKMLSTSMFCYQRHKKTTIINTLISVDKFTHTSESSLLSMSTVRVNGLRPCVLLHNYLLIRKSMTHLSVPWKRIQSFWQLPREQPRLVIGHCTEVFLSTQHTMTNTHNITYMWRNCTIHYVNYTIQILVVTYIHTYIHTYIPVSMEGRTVWHRLSSVKNSEQACTYKRRKNMCLDYNYCTVKLRLPPPPQYTADSSVYFPIPISIYMYLS